MVVGEDDGHDVAYISADDVLSGVLEEVEREVTHHVNAAELGLTKGYDDKAGFSLFGHYLQSTLQYWTSCLSLSLSAKIFA